MITILLRVLLCLALVGTTACVVPRPPHTASTAEPRAQVDMTRGLSRYIMVQAALLDTSAVPARASVRLESDLNSIAHVRAHFEWRDEQGMTVGTRADVIRQLPPGQVTTIQSLAPSLSAHSYVLHLEPER